MSQNQFISKIDSLISRKSGSWIKKKHFYLNEYAKIFTRGMGKKWPHLIYIDLFAGPGRCIVKEREEELDGSPLMMLQHNFTDYIFVEKEKVLMEALQKRCAQSPKFSSITFINEDCHCTISQVISKIPSRSLGLAFIDPTDINIPFMTVQHFAESAHGFDLLINVQLGIDIKRNFKRYKSEGDTSRLGRFLGGKVPWDELNDTINVIKLYKERIGKLGYGIVEYTDIPVHNTKKAQMYFLLFASKHRRGLDFWKKITRKDHVGQGELF